jgi:hypothetical protein
MALSSAMRKFLRGVEQSKALRTEALAFENGNAYVFREEVETRTPQHRIHRIYACERKPVPEHWPLLAGEAIQNLRASLDHVVYAVSGLEYSSFPICTTPGRFKRASTSRLRGIPASMRATIERAQPYRTSPTAPTRDPLEQLRTLSNIDKHRTLATVAAAVQHEGVGTNEGIEITWNEYATGKLLASGETHVSTFTVRAEREIQKVDVQPMLSYQVSIEGRPLDVLHGFARHVYRVLAECETGKPLSPFAHYPI